MLIVPAIDLHDAEAVRLVEGKLERRTVYSRQPWEVAKQAVDLGCAAILYTDIGRDGTGLGVNVEATARLARLVAPVEVIASGGVSSLADLAALQHAGVPSAVVGRALYEKTFTLEE